MGNVYAQGDTGPSLVGISGIAREPDGQWVVIATNPQTSVSQVVRIDSATGNRTIVSDANTGSGPTLEILRGIAVESNGQLLVVDTDTKSGRVLRVDPASGDRTIVSDANIGGGPAIGLPGGIAIEAGGQLIVLNDILESGEPQVLRIDPTSGNRSVVSDANTGSGPALSGLPGAVTLDAQGRIFVVLMSPFGVIMRVDPTNGNRTALSGFPGNLAPQAWGIAAEASGQLVVAASPNNGGPTVYGADPDTGDSSVVSSATVGGGVPFMGMLTGIAVDTDGQLLVTDFMFAGQGAGWVYQVDPASGNRSMFSPRQ